MAKAAGGGYQAIEEIAAKRLSEFGAEWDRAVDAAGRLRVIKALIDDCFHKKQAVEGEAADPLDVAISEVLNAAARRLGDSNGVEAAVELFGASRKRPHWRLFRSELWRDAERALAEVSAGRAENMAAATTSIRQRVSNSGRELPKRTVSTPMLLKGLEFDHVVIPDATHFAKEGKAQAKLFYVAISRATRSLTISSSSRWLSLPIPRA